MNSITLASTMRPATLERMVWAAASSGQTNYGEPDCFRGLVNAW